jgi:hypothetical protein
MKKILSLCCIALSCHLVADPLIWTGTPTTISTSGVNSSSVMSGVDANGNGVAAWIENTRVKVRNIPAATGVWGPLVTLSNAGATSPRIAVSSNGDATMMWLEGTSVKVANQVFGQSWSAATTLSTTSAATPYIAIDSTGNIVATWVSAGAVMSSTKLAGGSWQTAVTLASSGTDPRVAISTSGTVIAAWHGINSVSSMDSIYASQKTINGAWGSASVLSNPSLNSVLPRVAIDSNGNAVVLWFSYAMNGVQYGGVSVYSSILLSSAFSWTTPVLISDQGNVNPANLGLVMHFGSGGYGIAAWTNSVDGVSYNLSSAILQVTSGWGSSHAIVSDVNLHSESLALTSGGSAILSYMTTDPSTSNVIIQTLESYVGGIVNELWLNQQTISVNAQSAFSKVSAVNIGTATLNGQVVWVTYDGANTVVQAISGTTPQLQPPTSLAVSQATINYNLFADLTKTVTWTPSVSSNTSLYIIYRNGMLISQVDQSTPTFTDHNRTVGIVDTYGIASVDGSTGEQSSVILIAL